MAFIAGAGAAALLAVFMAFIGFIAVLAPFIAFMAVATVTNATFSMPASETGFRLGAMFEWKQALSTAKPIPRTARFDLKWQW